MKSDMPKGFNWLTELTELSGGKEIHVHQRVTLNRMAGNWPTCACGQLCELLERNEDGSPADKELRILGLKFAEYVSGHKWCLALETFNKIECRTTELLEEQGVLSPS
jgi:hypothetical protein